MSRAAATVAMPAPDTDGSGMRTMSGSCSVGWRRPRTVAGKTMSQLMAVPPAANRSASERRVAKTSGEVATTVSSAAMSCPPCARASRTQTDESAIHPSGRSGSTPARSPISVRSTGAGGCSATWTWTHRPSTPAPEALNRSAASMTGRATSTAAATLTRIGSRAEHVPVERVRKTAIPATTIATAARAAAPPFHLACLRRRSAAKAAR